jgi:hypothetical protein
MRNLNVILLGLFLAVGSAIAAPKYQLLSRHLAGMSEADQKSFIDMSVAEINDRKDLEELRFLTESDSGYTAVVRHLIGIVTESEFTDGTTVLGSVPTKGEKIDLVAVKYGHPLKSAYSFYFDQSKKLQFVYRLPEG